MNSDFDNLKIGDILVCSWGYSMILYDFYQVVGKTAKSVQIRALKKTEKAGKGFLRVIVKPIKNTFASDVLSRRVSSNNYIRGELSTQFMRIDNLYDPNICYEEDHAD